VNWERKEGLGLWKVPCFISLSSSCKEKECGRRQDGPLDWNRNTFLFFTGTGKRQTDLVGGLHVLNNTHIQRPRSASFPLLQQYPLPKAVSVF